MSYLTERFMTTLDTTFAALADPTRRAILARLATGETSVMELAKPFAMSLPAVSKHLKVLERAGLIARSREAQWRPCRIEPRALKEVDDWLEHYRRFYDESLDRLGDYLKKLQAQESKEKESKGKESKDKEAKGKRSAAKPLKAGSKRDGRKK
jgi:DNA-binding transcriptional ArsR family regulator